ncbi:MAG: hypothetical protein ACOCRO_09720 [Halanaerobiales bacterium]
METIKEVHSEEVITHLYNDPDAKKNIENNIKKVLYGRLKNKTANIKEVKYDIQWEQAMGGNMSCTIVATAKIDK